MVFHTRLSCMENNSSVPGWQKLTFQLSTAIAIATFGIYNGWQFAGYLVLICPFSSCLACVQTSPLPQELKNRERRRLRIAVVNRVPVYICINYLFVLSLTVEKAHVGRKTAQASVHRLAEHLHAISTQKSRYNLWWQSSQVKRTSQDPINVFIIRKLNRW